MADFDGLLLRGDRNANTAGLLAAMRRHGLNADKAMNQHEDVARSGARVVIALVPELPMGFPSLKTHLIGLSELDFVSFWTVNGVVDGIKGAKHVIPLKGFAEKRGTFLNHQGKEGHLTTPFQCPVADANCVVDVVKELAEAHSKVH
jgi:NADH-quinone oxidoreductase subunit G